jgi:hypothetical protein
MNRRRFVLIAAVTAVARTHETVAQECTVGFANGILRFSPDCSTLTIPGAAFGVSPPSHLVAPVSEGTATDVETPEERRIARLLEERERRDNKRGRRRVRQRTNNDQQAAKRDRRRAARNDIPQRSVSWSGVGPHITQGVEIGAGRYLATATIVTTATDNFIADLHGPNAFEALVVNEIPAHPGTYRYQRVVQVASDGLHFLDVEVAAGSWTIRLDPN